MDFDRHITGLWMPLARIIAFPTIGPLAESPVVFLILAAGMLLVLCLFFLLVFSVLARPWLQAFLSGETVALFNILGMRLRGNPPALLINAYIVLRKRGVDTTIGEIERTYIESKTRIFKIADLIQIIEAKKSVEQRRAT